MTELRSSQQEIKKSISLLIKTLSFFNLAFFQNIVVLSVSSADLFHNSFNTPPLKSWTPSGSMTWIKEQDLDTLGTKNIN